MYKSKRRIIGLIGGVIVVALIGGAINVASIKQPEETPLVTKEDSEVQQQNQQEDQELEINIVDLNESPLAMAMWTQEDEGIPFWMTEDTFVDDADDSNEDEVSEVTESSDEPEVSEETDNSENVDESEEDAGENDSEEEENSESEEAEDDEYIEGNNYCNDIDYIDESSSTEERILAIMHYLVSQGFDPAAAAAVCGNIAVESGYNQYAYGGNPYYGLCQWNYLEEAGYWWEDISSYMVNNGYDTMSFKGQVEAIVYAYHGQLEDDFESFKVCGNVEEATEIFCVWYEACPGGETCTEYVLPGSPYQGLATRKAEAWQAYFLYTGQQSEYTGEKPYVG